METNGQVSHGSATAGQFSANEQLIINTLVQALTSNDTGILSRTQLARTGSQLDSRRDIDRECGYPSTLEVTARDYQELFNRNGIALRVVSAMALQCWRVQPAVYESEDEGVVTEFEEAWDSLSKQIRGEQSWYNDEASNVIWSYLELMDIIAGIGHYGVLLLGLSDGKELAVPITPKAGMRLTFLRCFTEAQAAVTQWEMDKANPRYGQPVMYSLTFNDPTDSAGVIGATSTEDVHWTRCIHVVSEDNGNPVYGNPRMRVVLNDILDIRKMYGATGEGVWQQGIPTTVLSTHPQLGDVRINEPTILKIRQMLEAIRNGVQKEMVIPGMNATTLNSSLPDTSNQIDKRLEAIAIALDMPKRILMGNELGMRSAEEDGDKFEKNVGKRENNYCTTKLIVPFTDRLIWCGVLPEPPKGYKTYWPPLSVSSEQDKADVATKLTAALAQYAQSGLENYVPLYQYLVEFLKMSETQANAIIDSAEDQAQERDTSTSPLLSMVGGITGMVELFRLAKDGGLTEDQFKQQLILFFGLDESQAEAVLADGFAKMEEQREADRQAKSDAAKAAFGNKQPGKIDLGGKGAGFPPGGKKADVGVTITGGRE